MTVRMVWSAAAAVLAAACVAPVEEVTGTADGRINTAVQPLVGGHDSVAAQNYAVLISRAGTWSGGGVLLAPNLVLTDRFNVQELDTTLQGTCESYKKNKTGLGVQAGAVVAEFKEPIPVVQILTDGSSSSCEGPLAILELLTPLEGLPIARLRLDAPLTLGEAVHSIGYGHVTGGGTLPPGRQEGDGQVLLAGGGSYQLTASTVDVNAAFSLTSAPVCFYDNGGPLLDGAGDAIGVLHDHVFQDPNADTGSPFARCVGAFSLATAASNHTAFIERSMQRYGLMPWRTGQAAPPADLGGLCERSQDCNSNLCIDVGGQKQCSKRCADTSECETGASCIETATAKVCVTDVVDAPAPSNCSAGPVAPAGLPGLGAAAAVLFALVARVRFGAGATARRKRRPS